MDRVQEIWCRVTLLPIIPSNGINGHLVKMPFASHAPASGDRRFIFQVQAVFVWVQAALSAADCGQQSWTPGGEM
jgi:hypothetical protein